MPNDNLIDEKYNKLSDKLLDLTYEKEVVLNNKLYDLRLELNKLISKEYVGERTPLPVETIKKLEEFCRGVSGYKLDDFPPGSCKRGVKRESKAHVLGPFTTNGYSYYERTDKGMVAYVHFEIVNARYSSDSTIEKATACIGHGEIQQHPEGNWSIVVRKGIGTEDMKHHNVINDADDQFGRHATIAASDMCEQMCKFIYEHLTI